MEKILTREKTRVEEKCRAINPAERPSGRITERVFSTSPGVSRGNAVAGNTRLLDSRYLTETQSCEITLLAEIVP